MKWIRINGKIVKKRGDKIIHMKKREGEYSDFERFKRKAQTEDNYFITIFNEDNITTINLSEYRKTFFYIWKR